MNDVVPGGIAVVIEKYSDVLPDYDAAPLILYDRLDKDARKGALREAARVISESCITAHGCEPTFSAERKQLIGEYLIVWREVAAINKKQNRSPSSNYPRQERPPARADDWTDSVPGYSVEIDGPRPFADSLPNEALSASMEAARRDAKARLNAIERLL